MFVKCIIIISYQTLFQIYHTSKQEHKAQHDIEDMIQRPKGLRQSCPNKGFNKYTETCKNTLYIHTDTPTHTRTHKTCPKMKSIVFR